MAVCEAAPLTINPFTVDSLAVIVSPPDLDTPTASVNVIVVVSDPESSENVNPTKLTIPRGFTEIPAFLIVYYKP